jgi:hypothetical protein
MLTRSFDIINENFAEISGREEAIADVRRQRADDSRAAKNSTLAPTIADLLRKTAA